MTKPLILVTGANGTVGSQVVKQLVQGGHRVRALVRDPAKAKILGGLKAGRIRMTSTVSELLGEPSSSGQRITLRHCSSSRLGIQHQGGMYVR